MELPLQIDVALPYYGDVDLMKQAVRCVLNQEYQHWRLLVVDDGFPEPEPSSWFGGIDDPRVHYQRNTTNLGANANYRKCLTLVEAPVVVVFGADDLMLPNFLETIVKSFAAYPQSSVVQVGVQVVDDRNQVVRPLADRVKALYAPKVTGPTLMSGEALAVSLLRGNWTYFPSLAWKTKTITGIGFREGLNVTQDLALLLDTVRNGGSMVLDPTPAFLYRRHPASDSSVKALDGRRFDEERELFRVEAAKFTTLGWTSAARAARLHLTSRLNALSLLPTALSSGRTAALPKLGKHIFR